MPAVLAQLRAVLGPHAPILLGFDRGGAYPVAFTACRDAGADWVTYRRAPLVEATATPRRSWTVRDGRRVSMVLADETIQVKGYGDARQLTLFEHDQPVLQVLTSHTTGTGADLVCWLRARWRIENMFKYAAAHNGIDALACYGMDIGPDTRMVTNPARVTARKAVTAAEAELATAERALPQLLAGPGTPKQKNAAMADVHRRIEKATIAVQAAKIALRPVPAKVAATQLDPDAKQAVHACSAAAYRWSCGYSRSTPKPGSPSTSTPTWPTPTSTAPSPRNLLHLGGHVHYSATRVTITLDRPDSPRVARALQLLTDELNATPATIPGERRPLTYQVADA